MFRVPKGRGGPNMNSFSWLPLWKSKIVVNFLTRRLEQMACWHFMLFPVRLLWEIILFSCWEKSRPYCDALILKLSSSACHKSQSSNMSSEVLGYDQCVGSLAGSCWNAFPSQRLPGYSGSVAGSTCVTMVFIIEYCIRACFWHLPSLQNFTVRGKQNWFVGKWTYK